MASIKMLFCRFVLLLLSVCHIVGYAEEPSPQVGTPETATTYVETNPDGSIVSTHIVFEEDDAITVSPNNNNNDNQESSVDTSISHEDDSADGNNHPFVKVYPSDKTQFSDEEMATMVNGGFAIVELLFSDNGLENIGHSLVSVADEFVEDWKAIIYGTRVEDYSEAFKQQQLKLIQERITQIKHKTQAVETQTKAYHVKIEVFHKKLEGEVAEMIPQIKSFRHHVKNLSHLSSELQPQIIKIAMPILNRYRAVETEIKSLQQGHFPKSVIDNRQAELTDKLINTSVMETAAHIAGLMRMVNTETHPIRQQQLREVLRTVVDEQGIVKQWQKTHQPVTFSAPQNTALGIAIRQNYNEALGYFVTQTTPEIRIKAELGMQMVLDADAYFAKENKRWGNRLLNRARVLLDFMGNHKRVKEYQTIQSLPRAQTMFGFSASGNTFAGYELAVVSNKLAHVKDRLSDDLYFLGVLAAKQANNYQHVSEPTLFTTMLDNAYAVFDVASGFMKGVWRSFDETVDGILNTIVHPIDSASAIYAALVNYEQTYQIVSTEIKKFLAEFPNASAKQYGELAGRITFEIGSYFSGIGAITNLNKASKIVSQIQKIAKKTSLLAKASQIAIKAADNIAAWKASKLKLHMPGTPQKQKSTFSVNDVDKVRSLVAEALKSHHAVFTPNNDRSFRVVTDLGHTIGTRGETKIRVIVDYEGNIWNAFPVKVK
jgi:hypothetical protein